MSERAMVEEQRIAIEQLDDLEHDYLEIVDDLRRKFKAIGAECERQMRSALADAKKQLRAALSEADVYRSVDENAFAVSDLVYPWPTAEDVHQGVSMLESMYDKDSNLQSYLDQLHDDFADHRSDIASYEYDEEDEEE